MTRQTKAEAMRKYIAHIRNAEKKDYAQRYAIWLMRNDQSETVAPQPFHLSYMAAQAVRMSLDTNGTQPSRPNLARH
jgi:hypothetical protein